MSGLAEQLVELPPLLASHVRLTLISLAIGAGISLPLGVAATRRPRVEAIALAVASVLQTIPGLALLALMVPLLGFLGTVLAGLGLPEPPSIGLLPAVLALSLYSVLPMLRNTVTGIAGVDPAMREAARGVGMSPWEVLWQVEIPLAAPTIVAGIRTATVWVVGMATLATPVGAESLGNPIFAGLQMRHLEAVLVGSLAAAALALVLDGLVRSLEVGIQTRSGPRSGLAVAGVLVLALWSSGIGRGAGGDTEFELVLGSKRFTEQFVLAEILAQVAAEEPGVRVRRVPSLGSTVAFDGVVTGDVDVYVEYSGTVWATILGRGGLGVVDREAVLSEVEARLRDEYGITVLASLGFENTYALAMRGDRAEALDIRTVSDLVAHAGGLSIAGDYVFFERPEWRALEAQYGLAFAEQRAMDSTLMYEALVAESVDVISAYSTDGRIAAYGLRLLEDDRGVIPPYDAIVLGGARLAREAPGLVARLEALSGTIDGDAMRRMNAAVDLDGVSPARAAAEWLGHRRAASARAASGR